MSAFESGIEAMANVVMGYETSWKRSRKGNHWRSWGDAILTVFKRYGDWYGYSIAKGERVRFSNRYFRSRREAQQAAIEAASSVP